MSFGILCLLENFIYFIKFVEFIGIKLFIIFSCFLYVYKICSGALSICSGVLCFLRFLHLDRFHQKLFYFTALFSMESVFDFSIFFILCLFSIAFISFIIFIISNRLSFNVLFFLDHTAWQVAS